MNTTELLLEAIKQSGVGFESWAFNLGWHSHGQGYYYKLSHESQWPPEETMDRNELFENWKSAVDANRQGAIHPAFRPLIATPAALPATEAKPKCEHRYSRSINQPYPRHCLECGEIEPYTIAPPTPPAREAEGWIRFNANNWVRLKPNAEGREAFIKHWMITKTRQEAEGWYDLSIDVNGFMQIQLWEAFEIFGPDTHLSGGCFKSNDFYLDAKELDYHPTPPASEPSEQPNAEDAESLLKLLLADYESDWMPDEVAAYLGPHLESYARHTAAKAVGAERQRLARLVDERIEQYKGLRDDTGHSEGEQALFEFRSWLAGEGEKH